MPEGLEAEIYRRTAERTAGRTIASVDVDDRQAMAVELARLLPGTTVTGARRRGKHVLIGLDPDDAPNDDGEVHVLGLHFGMTGRLIVDGDAAIDELVYASRRDDPAWDRLVVTFADGSVLRVNDPRRWAVFTLDPDLSLLGPDFMELSADVLAAQFRGRRAAVKQVLLDQSVIAGFGNMCIDEVLWHAGIAPATSVADLDRRGLGAIVGAANTHLPAMLARGGSHTGVLAPEVRAACPPCPRDGAPMRRDTIGGRTTIWCPAHQIG